MRLFLDSLPGALAVLPLPPAGCGEGGACRWDVGCGATGGGGGGGGPDAPDDEDALAAAARRLAPTITVSRTTKSKPITASEMARPWHVSLHGCCDAVSVAEKGANVGVPPVLWLRLTGTDGAIVGPRVVVVVVVGVVGVVGVVAVGDDVADEDVGPAVDTAPAPLGAVVGPAVTVAVVGVVGRDVGARLLVGVNVVGLRVGANVGM